MTETPVWRLIITLGIPTTISMLITNIYNMADTYFVSTLSNAAGGATSIVFSIMAILQAFGFMFGHGAGSHVSRLLGAKDKPAVSEQYVEAAEGDLDLRPKQKKDSTFVAEPYFQVFSDRIPFQPNLSVLDLLMCEGKASIDEVLMNCQL